MCAKPLADADVYFHTEDFIGYGKTDAEGHYRLVQGAAVGDNKVSIKKLVGGEGVNPDPESGMDIGQLQAAAEGNVEPGTELPVKGPEQLVPPDYSDPSTTKLVFRVPDGGSTNADFDL